MTMWCVSRRRRRACLSRRPWCRSTRARQSAPDFYLHVTSGAILEDCREARFRPLQMDYKEMHADYNSSGLD